MFRYQPTFFLPETNSAESGSTADDFDIDKVAEESEIVEDFDYEDIDDYYKEEKESIETSDHVKNIFAASISSVVSTGLSQPLDVLKLKLQSQHKTTNNMMYRARIIYIEEGLRGFWRNHKIAQFVSLTENITLFWTFEQLRNALNLLPVSQHSELCDFMAGFISAGVIELGSHPVIKMRTQIKAQKRLKRQYGNIGVAQGISHSSRSLRHIYRGVLPKLIYMCPLYGCKFMLYNGFCDYMIVHTDFAERYDLQESVMLLAGAMSGMVSVFVHHPLDVIKRRMQYGSLARQHYKFDETCRSFWQCAGKLLQQRGVFGFYSGVLPNMLRSALHTSFQFGIFDNVRQWAEYYM